MRDYRDSMNLIGSSFRIGREVHEIVGVGHGCIFYREKYLGNDAKIFPIEAIYGTDKYSFILENEAALSGLKCVLGENYYPDCYTIKEPYDFSNVKETVRRIIRERDYDFLERILTERDERREETLRYCDHARAGNAAFTLSNVGKLRASQNAAEEDCNKTEEETSSLKGCLVIYQGITASIKGTQLGFINTNMFVPLDVRHFANDHSQFIVNNERQKEELKKFFGDLYDKISVYVKNED